MKPTITIQEFNKVDLRIGTIINVEDFPEVRNPAYKLYIDFGDLGIKKTSAQITALYSKAQLINTQVIAVVNFPKKQIANIKSECLVLGAVNNKEVSLLRPLKIIENGKEVS